MKNTLAFPFYAPPSLIISLSYFLACQLQPLPPPRGGQSYLLALAKIPPRCVLGQLLLSPAPNTHPPLTSVLPRKHTQSKTTIGAAMEERTINIIMSLHILIKL